MIEPTYSGSHGGNFLCSLDKLHVQFLRNTRGHSCQPYRFGNGQWGDEPISYLLSVANKVEEMWGKALDWGKIRDGDWRLVRKTLSRHLPIRDS